MNALQRDLKKLVPLVESLGAERVESDPHRQRFHVQPTVGWLNDPNGLCRIGDTYHVFYQYALGARYQPRPHALGASARHALPG